MFEQAERFTRTTVLPLVSNFTPKFFTDIFAPKSPSTYIPFPTEESTNNESVKLEVNGVIRNKRNKKFNPPPTTKRPRRRFKKNLERSTESTIVNKTVDVDSTVQNDEHVTDAITPLTNIQIIPRKKTNKMR